MGGASIFHWLIILIPFALVVWLVLVLVARGRRSEAPQSPARIVPSADREQP